MISERGRKTTLGAPHLLLLIVQVIPALTNCIVVHGADMPEKLDVEPEK